MTTERKQNESALVCAAQRSDKEALQRLLVRNWPWLKGLVYSILGDADQVDDVLQDICVRVIAKIDSLREPEQLQDLHERSCEVVVSEIIARGKESEEIFEQAWQRQAANPLRRTLKLDGRLCFSAGLAAGLTIGLILHFVLPLASTPQSEPIPTKVVVDKIDAEEFALPQLQMNPAGNSLRNVDWYSFTDKQGNQWLIEGLRENIVRPAVYYGDL